MTKKILMHWEERFELNVLEMDNDHKKLIDLMNALYELYGENAPFSQQLNTLQELGEWTSEHFRREEAYMESIDYAGIRVHKGTHQSLLKKFTEYLKRAQSEEKIDPSLFSFLRFWLSSHICGIDKKYGEYQKEIRRSA